MAKRKKLKPLRKRHCAITGQGFEQIHELKNIERLELRLTSVDDQALDVISNFPKLNYLELTECRLLTETGISKIGKLTNLATLDLLETKTTDTAMAALSSLSKLTELNLEATKISNKSVDSLLKLKELARLNINGTRLDDEAASRLKELPKLVWISVNNSGIGYAGVDEMKAARPGLEVVE